MPIWLWIANLGVGAAALFFLWRLLPCKGRAWSPIAAVLALVWMTAAVLLVRYTRRLVSERAREKQFQQRYITGLDEKNHGNLEEAERQFQQALAIRPGDPDAQRHLQELKQQRTPEQREQTRATEVTPSAAAPATPGERPGRKPAPIPHKPSPFEITHYGLEIDLDPAGHAFKALATLRIRSRGSRVDTLDFSLNAECKPTEVTFNGAPASFRHPNDLLAVSPRRPLEPGRDVVVTVRYARRGSAVLRATLDMLDARACYLRSESRWYPATGELDFRAPVRVQATVPAGYSVVSVGSLRAKTTAGKRVRFHWETDRPASMVSLAAARYVVAAASVPPVGSRRIPLPIACYTFPEHRDRAAQFLKETGVIVRYFERLFGPYPYEKLAVVEIPLFPGGYGTTSFVMLIEDSFAEGKPDREFVAHEIAHQWWGNSVFPQGLGAAWLSEAFAEYSAWMYAAAAGGNPRILQRRVAQATTAYLKAVDAQGDEPILETDVYRPVGARDATLYEKGAVVLHMLRREMGDAAFKRLLRTFAEGHRHGKADIPQFRQLAAHAAGRDLAWFFDQWLGRGGAPQITYAFETLAQGPKQTLARITVTQPQPAYRLRLTVAVEADSGSAAPTIRTSQVEIKSAREVLAIPVSGPVRSLVFDPPGDLLIRPPRWDPG